MYKPREMTDDSGERLPSFYSSKYVCVCVCNFFPPIFQMINYKYGAEYIV